MGVARKTALASSMIFVLKVRILTFTGQNWKCHFINVIIGLVRTVRQIPQANALGIWLPLSHAPSCIVTTKPSRTGLNPLNNRASQISHHIMRLFIEPYELSTMLTLSAGSSSIHLKSFSQAILQPSINKICLKISYLKCYSNLLGPNELITNDHCII